MFQLPELQQIQIILSKSLVIAVVGLSPKPERPSNQVASYLLSAGYRVIPVNPGHDSILGQVCYPELMAVPDSIDIVNIFRRSEQVLPVVQAAIKRNAKVIWMQEGIIHEGAARLAESQGMTVIMNRCIMVDHQQFLQNLDEV